MVNDSERLRAPSGQRRAHQRCLIALRKARWGAAMTETLTAIAMAPLALISFAGLWFAARTRARNRRLKTRLGFDRPRGKGDAVKVALAGMPPRSIHSTISTAGRCPALLFYFPVLLYCLGLAWRHRGFTLPSVANPNIECGGFRGESKMSYLEQISPKLRCWVVPSRRLTLSRGFDTPQRLASVMQEIEGAGLAFPLVAKPDIGSQGYGVRLLRGAEDLAAYLKEFPTGESIILQRYIPWEGEAGVHYIRRPGESQGAIFSLGFRCFPHVIGDGHSRLGTLIDRDPRTRRMARRHRKVAGAELLRVPAAGEMVRLSLLGSVRVGAFYYDGAAHITPALTARIDEISRTMPEFYFGRYDIRFKSIDALRRGEDFQILEMNGASAEALHIWDPEQTVGETYRVLFEQFRLLYEIGAHNRARGHRPISLTGFLALQWRESRLVRRYPASN